MSGTILFRSQPLPFSIVPAENGADVSFGRALAPEDKDAAEAQVWDTVCENPA